MVDVVFMSNKHRTLIIAKTPLAKLKFTEYQDVYKNSAGDSFIMRSNETARELKQDFITLGYIIEDK